MQTVIRRFHEKTGALSSSALLLFAVVLASTTCAPAQTSQGFTGVVADSTNAIVPLAKVTVHNEGTGVEKRATTTSSGNYAIPFLDPGVYDIKVEASGFKSLTKTKITLTTDQTVAVNFSLPVGEVSELITVDASANVLDYVKADRGDVVEQQRISELPVLAGDAFNLAGLSAGVVNTIGPANYNSYNQTAQSLSIHGAGIELNIDGASDLSMTGAQNYAYDPPNDAVKEFKITTNAYDAVAGRSPGGAIDLTLKSGGKQIHGDAYETMRRGFLDANSSVNNASRALNGPLPQYNRPQHTQDYFGFEVDGPVLLPKLWPRQRQTFFMVAYREIKNLAGSPGSSSVPTQAMIGNGTLYPGQGDFSGLLTANGAAYNQPIYDPLSEAACTANNTDNGSYGNKNPHVCRYQFGYGPGASPGPQGNPVAVGPANVIPASRINPVASAALSWYANPNQAPTPTTANNLNNNFFQNNVGTNLERNYIVKFDQNVGENDTIYVAGRLWTEFGTNIQGTPRNNVNAAHPGLNWSANGAHYTSRYRNPSLLVGWTHTFNASLVNSFKGSILVTDQTDFTGPANGFNPSSLGLPASLSGSNPNYFNRFPLFNINSFQTLGSLTGLERGDDELSILDVLSFTHKNHTMRAGFDWRPSQYSQRSSGGAGTQFTVAKGWTQQWDTVVSGGATGLSTTAGYSGNAVASLLLGTADSGSAISQPDNYYSIHYLAGFLQDDWKVSPKLTLNLGVRWDQMGGYVDRHNRQVWGFDSSDVNPISSLVNSSALPINGQLLGGITYAGVNGNPRAPFRSVFWQFGPRVGFAYVLNSKTVLRGGMGLYYIDDANGGSGGSFASPQTGYASTTTYNGSNDNGQTPLVNFSNPFPVLQTPVGNCGGNQIQCLTTNAGQTLTFINPKFYPPPFTQFSLGIERQFTANDTIEISYTGSRGYDTQYNDDLNHVSSSAQAACDPERGGMQTNCTSGASTGTGGYIANPFKGLAPFAASGNYYTASTIQRINFTRPFPVFTTITESSINGGKYWYNGLEASLNHRASKGLTLHATYTYSKAMQSGGYADTVNRVPLRTISTSDIPHRITVSEIYKLPLGRGYGFFPTMNRYVDLLVGGWQASSIFTYQSGFPATISGYEINPSANGGYILPRKRIYPGQTDPYHAGKYAPTNSYVQAFKPCVGTRDPNTGAVTLTAYAQAAGCGSANFIPVISGYGVTPNVIYTGVRLQRIVTLDANISKNFKIYDRLGFQLRMDAFNALNHVIQSTTAYDTSSGDSNFGTYQMGTAGGGNYLNRQVQLTGRLIW